MNQCELLKKIEALLKASGMLESRRQLISLDHLLEGLEEDAANAHVAFDTESIHNAHSYVDILKQFQKVLSKDNDFEIVSSFHDKASGRVGVSIGVNGAKASREWDQKDDWVASELFDLIDEIKPHLRGALCNLSLGQTYRALYVVDRQIASQLSLLFRELGDREMGIC